MTVTWHGVIAALMTAMKQDGALDLAATTRHIESCLSAGFVMLGTLDENSSLSPGDKESVVRAPRLTLVGEERKRVEAIVKQALATRPNLLPIA